MAEQTAEITEETDSDDDFDSYLPRKRHKSQADPTRLVEEYLRSDSYDIQLIKGFPILEKLFRKYNTALPSSAPVERMFSGGGGIFNKRRQCLQEDQFKMQLLLKMNEKFWRNP